MASHSNLWLRNMSQKFELHGIGGQFSCKGYENPM